MKPSVPRKQSIGILAASPQRLSSLAPARVRMGLCALLTATVCLSGRGAAPLLAGQQPSLVLSVVIDGLDGQRLEQLMPYFGDGGFRRLVRQGVTVRDVDFGTPLSPSAATAVLMTGASPVVTGIGAETAYDYEHRVTHPVMADPSTIGNYTRETYSPNGLKVTTLADEVKIAGAGTALVYALGSTPAQAILMAGHAANNAAWLSDTNAAWAASTHYKEFPGVLQLRNRTAPLASRMDTMQWTPSAAAAAAEVVPEPVRHYPFRHVFGRGNPSRTALFKTTPLYNREVVDVATDYIATLGLGTRRATDMLAVGMTARPFTGTKGADATFQDVDAYIRLDAELARLLSAVDSRVGADRAVVMVAGTPREPLARRDDPQWGVPTGEFSVRRALSLLNLYLMAVHGNGEWTGAWADGGWLYLNHDLAKERDVDLALLRRESAAFLRRMAGVGQAWSLDDIVDGRAGDNAAALRRNTPVQGAGDVMVDIMPGWAVTEIPGRLDPAPEAPAMVQRAVAPTAPLFLMAPGRLAATEVSAPVDARAVAPTVASILRIRSPSGSSAAPLRLSKLND